MRHGWVQMTPLVRSMLADAAASVLGAARCPLCHAPRVAGLEFCGSCAAELSCAPGIDIGCEGIDRASALGSYSGALRSLVLALKYRGRPSLAAVVAEMVLERLPPARLESTTLVAVPRSPLRSSLRGYDPARETAAVIAARSGRPIADPLVRLPGPRQTGRAREDRLDAGPRVRLAAPAPPRALLIDDVMTTGSTLRRCAEELRRGGSVHVDAQVIAFTARRGGSGGGALPRPPGQQGSTCSRPDDLQGGRTLP